MKRNDIEHQIQKAAIEQLDHLFSLRWPEWMIELEDSKGRRRKVAPIYAVPNGGNRNLLTAVKLRSEGARSGVWDLAMDIPTAQYSCLRIEVKTPNGRLSKNQVAWRQHYDSIGAEHIVCYSAQEIVNCVIVYMEG